MRYFSHRPFLKKMTIVLCVLSLMPYLIFQLVYHNKIKEDIIDSAYNLLESVVDSQVSSMCNQLSTMQTTLMILDHSIGKTLGLDHIGNFKVLDKQRLLENLSELAQTINPYSYLGVVDIQNHIIYASRYGVSDIRSSRFSWLESYAEKAFSQNTMLILTSLDKGTQPFVVCDG